MSVVKISITGSSASSQEPVYPSSQAFNGIIAPQSWWQTIATDPVILENEWVVGHLSSGQAVNKIRYYACAFTSKNIKHAKFEGSNDGVNWTKIPATGWTLGASQYNGDEILFASAEGWQEVTFNNNTAYTRYRLFCYDSYVELESTQVHMAVAELEFYYDDHKPIVTSFAINSGASSTKNREVTLNNVCTGDPTHYMASEDPNFVLSKIWQGNHDLTSAGNKVQDFDAGSSVDWELFSLTVQSSANIQFRSKSAATQGGLGTASYGDWQDGITGSITAGNNRWLRVEIKDTTYIPAGYTPIYDVDDLQAMQDDLAGNYWLANDIDASDTINWNGGAGFESIGVNVGKFTGIFDGDGHTITDLFINNPVIRSEGLFGWISGTVRNVGITSNITSNSYYAGGLVGVNSGGTVTNCYSTGAVSGSSAGGLVGVNSGGTVTNCYSISAVSASSQSGGLVGSNASGGIITNCYSTGAVSGGSAVGGFVAYNTGTVTDCFWDTQTSGQATSAGGTGKTTAQMKQEATFTNWDFTDIWAIIEDVDYPILR